MKKVSSILLAVCLSWSLAFAGCGQPEPTVPKEEAPSSRTPPAVAETAPTKPDAPAPQEKPVQPEGPHGTLRYATSAQISALNPHAWSSSSDGDAIEQTTMKLYKFFPGEDGKYSFEAEAADGDPVAMDQEGTEFQIKIKTGLKWSDGEEINADDFLYSWRMGLDPKMVNSRGGTLAEDYIKILNAKDYYMSGSSGSAVKWEDVGLKKVDDHTIAVTTLQKYSPEEVKTHFTQTWTALVKEDLYEGGKEADGTSTQYGTDIDKVGCCGAYTIESWNKGAEIVYGRNPDYVYADRIHLEKMKGTVVKDPSTRMQLFENGQIDYVGLSTNDFKQYEEDPRVLTSNASGVNHITVNCGSTEKPILGDVNFRLALFYGVDRESIADIVYGIPANWAVPTKKVGNVETGEKFRDMAASNEYLTPNCGYDPQKAKEYFDKAMSAAGLEKLTLTLNYSDSSESAKLQSEFLQKSLPEIFGADRFELKLQGMPFNQLIDAAKGWQNNPNSYELSWSTWDTNTIAPWNGLKTWTTSYGKKNEPYSNAQYDELWEKANNGEERFDPQLRLELTRQMEKILLDEAGIIPVVEIPGHTLKSDHIVLPWEGGSIPKVGYGWMYSSYVE